MKPFSITSGVPAPIWYALAIVAGSYYAIFFSGRPQLWIFAIVYWVLVGVFLYCYSRVQPFDIFSPIIGLIILLFLYSFASGLFVEEFGVMYFGEAVSDWVLGVYYLCCLVGLAGLAFGTLFGSTSTRSPRQQSYERSLARGARPNLVFQRRLIFWALVFAIGLGSFVLPQFNFFHVASYAERALAVRIERSGIAIAGLREVFLSQLPVTLILCAATLLMLRARRRWAKLWGIGVFLAYLVANTLAGWRGSVVAALLIPLIYYHYRIKPLSTRLAVIGAVSIYVFVNGLSVARSTSDPLEMLRVMRETIGANGLAFANISTSGELVVGQNLMRLISGIQSGETGFTYGASVLTDLLVFVPRSFYPGRPLPLPEKFVEVFYPGVLESGGGYGFFILQDGYWAFGIAGVFVFMFVYGWVVQRIYLGFMRHLTDDLALFAYSAVYAALVLAAIRTGMVGSFKGAIINAVPFFVLWMLLKVSVLDSAIKRAFRKPNFVEAPT